jgi:hypothetical protein
MLLAGIALAAWVVLKPRPRDFQGNVFPHALGLMWLVLIVQNVIAQLITGPGGWGLALFSVTKRFAPHAGVVPEDTLVSSPVEMDFALYYGVLFLITAAIITYYHRMKARHETLAVSIES